MATLLLIVIYIAFIGLGIPEGKMTVRKAITEGVKRFFFHIAVGASLHCIIRECRQILIRMIKSDRQLPLRIAFPEQGTRYGPAALGTGVPCLQNGGCPFLRSAQGQRTAAQHHHHHRT